MSRMNLALIAFAMASPGAPADAGQTGTEPYLTVEVEQVQPGFHIVEIFPPAGIGAAAS